MIKFAFTIIAAFVIATMLVMAKTVAASHADNRIVTDKIHTALSAGTATMPSEWNRDRKTGIDTYTDGLVLEITNSERRDIITALTREEYAPHYSALPASEGGHPCDRLSDKVGPRRLEKLPDD